MITIVTQGAERVGGLGRLAEGLGIKHQAFYSWKKVPAERVLDFERLTGISRHEQRPDIFGYAQAQRPTPCDVDNLDAAAPGVVAGPVSPTSQAGTGAAIQKIQEMAQ